MCYTEFRCVPSTFIWTHTFSMMPSSLWRGLYGALIDHNMNWLVITGPLLLPMSLWHHRSACSAVNQEVGGLSPPRDVLHSCVSNCILPYCVLKFFKLSLLSILHTHWLCAWGCCTVPNHILSVAYSPDMKTWCRPLLLCGVVTDLQRMSPLYHHHLPTNFQRIMNHLTNISQIN